MRAIVVKRPGGYDQLICENVEEPACGDEDVIVSVLKAGVNYADCLVRLGLYKSAKDQSRYPITPGFDFAGIIERIGKGVSSLKPGDRVFGVTLFGAYQERISIHHRYVRVIPPSIDFAGAASLPTAFLTASYILNDLAHIRSGESLLIRSIGGGVGSWLALLAKRLGVNFKGTVSTLEKRAEVAGRVGGSHVLLESEIKGEDRYDVIANAKGGSSISFDLKLLNPRGRLVLYGFHGMVNTSRKGRLTPLSWFRLGYELFRTPHLHPFDLVNKNRSVLGFNLSYLFHEVQRYEAAMDELQEILSSEHEIPPVTEFPLSDVAKAHQLLESGRSVGKIVLSM